MDVNKAIVELRKSKKVTQSAIAKKMGITQASYSKLEKRGNKMTFEQIDTIAQILGMTGVDLIKYANNESGEVVSNKKVEELKARNRELEEKTKALENVLLRSLIFMMDVHDFHKSISAVIEKINPTGKDKERYNEATLEELTKGFLACITYYKGKVELDAGFLYSTVSGNYLRSLGDYSFAENSIQIHKDASDKVDEINNLLPKEVIDNFFQRLNRQAPEEMVAQYMEALQKKIDKK